MVVYKITNIVDGKIYVGMTKNKPGHRWSQHKRDARRGSKYLLHVAINKYGVENFKFEIIDTASSVVELIEKEAIYIKELNSLKPNGYNMLDKSQQGADFIPWNKGLKGSIKANSGSFSTEKCSGENNCFYGKKHTEENKRKQSELSKRIWKEKREALIDLAKKRWESQELRNEMSLKKGGKSFFIIDFNTNEILGKYINMGTCAKEFNLCRSVITQILKHGKQKTKKNNKFYTFRYVEKGE